MSEPTRIKIDGDYLHPELRAALIEATADPTGERLKRYWTEGEGAAKIRWGEAGDFMRCVHHLAKYIADPQGYCSDMHQRATGFRPGHAPTEQKAAGVMAAGMVHHWKHGWIPLDGHTDSPGLGAVHSVHPSEVREGDTIHQKSVLGPGVKSYHVTKVHPPKSDGSVNVDVTDEAGRPLALTLPGHADVTVVKPKKVKAGGVAELRNVEIARVGKWHLASGELDVTPQMIADAAAYGSRPGARPAPIKIGHGDPRFDGEPALGWLQNLRVEGTGADSVLVGDIVDMPEWLAAAAPKHWPDRSMEGWTDKVAEDGRTYSMVVDGLALLGVSPPGMSSLRSLRDLPQALGVAASSRMIATAPAIEAASDKPWSQFSQADYTDQQWAHACILHRDGMSGKDAHGLPIREPGGALNRNGVHAAAARINQVQGASVDAKKSAARALLRAYGELNEDPPESLRRIAAAEDSQVPPPASAAGPINTEGGSAVAFSDEQITNLRAKLQLPDTADEAAIVAAITAVVDESLEEHPPAASPPSGGQVTPPAPEGSHEQTPEALPIAAGSGAPGTMVIDASAWTEREDRIKRLEAADAKRRREERDQVVSQAIQAGKFPPSRAEHWQRLWDADPEGARLVIASLTPNVVPVDSLGEFGDGEESVDQEFSHLFPPTPKGV